MKVDIRSHKPYAISAFCIAFILAVFFIGGEPTRKLWDEGTLVESNTALWYFLGCIVFGMAARKAHGLLKWWLWLWALMSVVFFGEETSWMQAYLNYATPEHIAAGNRQGEFNLHNLYIFQSYSVASEAGGLKNLLSAEILFELGFLGYFLGLPVACLIPFFRRIAEKLKMPLPGLRFAIAVWAPVFLSVALTLLSAHGDPTRSAMAEIREMFFGIAIGAFSWLCWRQVKETAPQ
jgi:hypothetical protein